MMRRKSSTGIYHVMLRGINRQMIFADNEDYEKFLQILGVCKEISGCKIYAYCLMGNHVHLIIKEEAETIDQVMKRIGARFVYWYNWKYKRSGHLFQDRFKSETIEEEGYFLTVLRYIHQNPKKAGISKNLEAYRWSSYNEYLGQEGLTDTDFGLDIIGKDRFVEFMNEPCHEKPLEIEEEKTRLTDEELTVRILKEYHIKAPFIQKEETEKRDEILKSILKDDGISTRQLARVTGISTNIIWKL